MSTERKNSQLLNHYDNNFVNADLLFDVFPMRNKDADESSRNRYCVRSCGLETADRIVREAWLKIVTKEDLSGGKGIPSP